MINYRLLTSLMLVTCLHLATLTAAPHATGLVKVATACMRAEPAHSSELVSQAVLGTPLEILDDADGWLSVMTPDGYTGYMIDNALIKLSDDEAHRWRQSQRVMYSSYYTGRILSTDGSGTPVSDIHSGSVVEVIGTTANDSVDILMPDGRTGRLATNDVRPLERPVSDDVDTVAIVEMARALMGVSYLWGGTTTAGMDCSGLVKICYLNQGLILPRDASQQAQVGMTLNDDRSTYRRGDLVFFKSPKTGRINHVGIYDHDGMYVHCSGQVKENSLDPLSPQFIPSNLVASGCRIAGNLGTTGITRIIDHPMYFNVDGSGYHPLVINREHSPSITLPDYNPAPSTSPDLWQAVGNALYEATREHTVIH